MNESLKLQSERLMAIVGELEKAVAHAHTAAGHFQTGEVPVACAHSLALEGHLVAAKYLLEALAHEHRLHARPS